MSKGLDRRHETDTEYAYFDTSSAELDLKFSAVLPESALPTQSDVHRLISETDREIDVTGLRIVRLI